MRLIKSVDKGVEQTESPHVAARMVKDALMRGRHTIEGLNQIGSPSRLLSDSDIVDAVRQGDLLLVRPRSASSGGGLMRRPAPAPEPVYIRQDRWPSPKPRDDLVFAKSCISENWCRTHAGTTTEPASNFGRIMIAGAMLFPSASTAIATAIGADFGLGRVAGGGILQQRLNWVVRGSGGPASVFILGMLPAKLADGTLHTDEQLRNMSHATTRVRFQFRQDAEGVLQVYGIHSGASGDDSVRTVQVTWNADKTAMEAKLNGITILWTPQHGQLGSIPPLTYPENIGDHLGSILVHPIPEDVDSQIDGLPGEDITADDCILVFPADTGLKSLYVVFARPLGGDHSYHQHPNTLAAFPDAVRVNSKSRIQGGGGTRRRWKDHKGRIYEWDYENGRVELYNKQGRHLGEFNADTGEQTKPAKPGRYVEK
jgi:hypothetical protein